MFTRAVELLLDAASPRIIVEVGAATGATTAELLERASQSDSTVHSIDPSPDPQLDLSDLKQRYGDRFVFHGKMSLDALENIDQIDAVLIDGDHNWYTVYHELKLLERKAAEQKRWFPLTLLHDVDWPYGRRDMYYNPDSIPEEFRQPFKKAGIIRGQAELSASGGVNAEVNNAVLENVPRSGVRTAVEDFLSESELALRFQSMIGFHGLGILVSERQLEENKELRRVVDELESPAWLRSQCEHLEHERLRLEALRQSSEKANR
jgi:hypothetical protein